MSIETCFHCAEPIPPGCALTINHESQAQPFCCAGCQAVAALIIDGGQGDYYRFRDATAERVDERALSELAQWEAFDQAPQINAEGLAHADLLIEGIHCGACTWLIETQLGRLPGVATVQVDQQSGQARLEWRPEQLRLSEVLQRLVRIGYRPHPLDQAGATRMQLQERNDLLKRLAVAGLGMMQVMMYAVGTYFGVAETGHAGGMDPAIERLLFLVSMVIATPVVFYAGAPFISGAWRSLRAGQPGMDVPVTLALLLAYSASCVNFFRGAGPMYFESATMFVFLLLASRFVAMQVRHRSTEAQLALAPMLPDVVLRIDADTDTPIPRATLAVADLVRLRPGDAFAADGTIVNGATTINEALLSGESAPQPRETGDAVLAGSINIDGVIEMRVTAIADQTHLAQMTALLSRAQQQRPERVQLANRVASYFVVAILALASAVFLAWWQIDTEQAFAATLAVLVVTCPCALSLAIPTALSAAATRLARSGLLVSRLDVLETLAKVTLVLFDKTGTLSNGTPRIGEVKVNPKHPRPLSRDDMVGLVAALERHSNHPLSRAFTTVAISRAARDVEVIAGRGVTGRIDDRLLRIGNPAFVGMDAGIDVSVGRGTDSAMIIMAADQNGLLGEIAIADSWRDDAVGLIVRLRKRGIVSRILSGDRQSNVDDAVTQLRLEAGIGGLLPEQKLAALADQQQAGQIVLAVGDGVNDTALLAGADVSVALAEGADLAQAGADIVLTGTQLSPLAELLDVADQTQRIIRQNLGWAIGYNLVAIPLAALGWIGPGLAALGMSISSLVVVLNAARLIRTGPARNPGPTTRPNAAPVSAQTDRVIA